MKLAQLRRPLLSLLLVSAPALACGAEEVSAITKFADQMCACKDVACAEKLFPEIEKMTKANEGKEVIASAAEKYGAEVDRTQKCYEKIHEEAEKADAAK